MTARNERSQPGRTAGFKNADTGSVGKKKNTAVALPKHDALSLVLSRMSDVRRDGTGWRARCPACGGNAHKVAIAEGDDGRLLIHCFGCADTRAILQSIGLEWRSVFPARYWPESPKDRREAFRPLRGEIGWRTALPVLAHESAIVQVAAGDLLKGHSLAPEDHARLQLACYRIAAAREVLR